MVCRFLFAATVVAQADHDTLVAFVVADAPRGVAAFAFLLLVPQNTF